MRLTGWLNLDILYQSSDLRTMLRRMASSSAAAQRVSVHLQVLLDRRRFAELSRSRAVQIVAIHPYSDFVDRLSFLLLRPRLGRR